MASRQHCSIVFEVCTHLFPSSTSSHARFIGFSCVSVLPHASSNACRTTEGVVRLLVQRLVDQKRLVPAKQAMCRISVSLLHLVLTAQIPGMCLSALLCNSIFLLLLKCMQALLQHTNASCTRDALLLPPFQQDAFPLRTYLNHFLVSQNDNVTPRKKGLCRRRKGVCQLISTT